MEAVPAALARDRKKLDGNEVSVSMLWRSTLFVTNFSRDTDAPRLRQLFSQVRGIGNGENLMNSMEVFYRCVCRVASMGIVGGSVTSPWILP